MRLKGRVLQGAIVTTETRVANAPLLTIFFGFNAFLTIHSPWMLLYLPDSVILMTGSGERIDAKVIARARTNKLVLYPKAKVNPATVN